MRRPPPGLKAVVRANIGFCFAAATRRAVSARARRLLHAPAGRLPQGLGPKRVGAASRTISISPIVRRKQAGKPAIAVQHADRRGGFGLKQAERLVKRVPVSDGRHIGHHCVADLSVRAELLEGANQPLAAEQSNQSTRGVDHRKLALTGAQQGLDRLIDMRVRTEHRELRHHGRADRNSPRHGSD